MSVVNVNTETLKAGSASVKKFYNDNKGYYDALNSKSIANCKVFENFKNALKSAFNNYENHSNKLSEKLSECADALEETDSSIGGSLSSIHEQLSSKKTNGVLTTTATVSDEYVNPYDPENLPKETLYDMLGVLKFTQNGKRVYETFCNTCLKHSNDLKFLILKMGYDAGFWYREDGVQMWGEDVMYGGDIPEWGPGGIEDESRNPSNSTRRRGDKFYGTSGPGRIVGYGGTCVKAHLGQFYPDGTAYDETYDTYTAWKIDSWAGNYDKAEYEKYTRLYSSKDEAHATRNVINNPPADPSERYYQTNESWVNLFDTYTLTREYIPEGVVDWNSNDWRNFDWVSYFQINNPDKITA